MRKGIYIFCLCLFVFSFYSKAQVGKEFWFVAPDVTHAHGDKPLKLRVTALDNDANVTISMPGSGTILLTDPKSPMVVPAGRQIDFRIELKGDVENRPSNSINNKGILITSDQDITVYYEVANGVNPDKFTLKASNALGKEFFVPSQNSHRNFPLNPKGTEKVDIVATEDGTEITIVPTENIVGHSKNVPFTINLDRGETFCLENRDDVDKNSSLAGTHIESNKNIAVTISDDSIWEEQYHRDGWAMGPYDLIGDQLIPVSVIGNEYIAIRSNKDHKTLREVYVLATEDNTYITVNNDVTLPIVLNKGEQTKIDIADFYADFTDANSIYIKSSKPVYAYQLASFWNRTGNEMGSAVLPPVNCTGSRSISFVRTFDLKFYVQLLTQSKNRTSFTLKDQAGNSLSSVSDLIYDEAGNDYANLNDIPWNIVEGTGADGAPDTWYSAVVSMRLTTGEPYTIANSDGLFHMSILDENQGSTSYGYFSSYGQLRLEAPDVECVGNVIVLSTVEPMKNYNWYSEKTGQVVQATTPTYEVTESGTYWVTAEVNFGGCVLTESVDVEFALPEFDLGPDTLVCPGQEVRLSVEDGLGDYDWSTGSTNNEALVTMTGATQTVSLTVTDEFNCSNTDSKEISTHPVPVISLNRTEVCEGQNVINQTPLVRYEWRFGNTLLNSDWTQNYITPTQTGTYTLTAWDATGCPVTQDFDITVNDLPVFDVPDQLGCVAATTTINVPAEVAGAGYTYLWSDGSTLNHINLTTPADLTLQVTDPNGCVATDDFNFDYAPATSLDLGEDREECAGITLTIDQGNSYHTYEWKFQAGGVGPIVDLPTPTPEHALDINGLTTNSGRYYVSALDQFGCEVADNVQVTFVTVNPPAISKDQNLCEAEPITISATAGYASYSWKYETTDLPDVTNAITVNTAGKYTVRASIGGCFKDNTIDVKGFTNPSVNIADELPICKNSRGTIDGVVFTPGSGLAAERAFDYLVWNDGHRRYTDLATAKLDVASTDGATYKVTAYAKNGCKAEDNIRIRELGLPLLELGAPRETCENITIDLVNPTAVANYEWHRLTSAGAVAGPVNANWTVNTAGSYRLTITDANGCVNDDVAVVRTLPIPVIDLGADRDMCEGEILQLAVDGGYAEYIWNGDPTLNTNTLSVTGAGVTNYGIEVRNVHGCWTNDNVTITAHAATPITIADQIDCAGTEFTFSGPATHNSYKWSTGETSSSISVEPGVYSLAALNANGCLSSTDFKAEWYPIPNANLGNDTIICPIDQVELIADAGYAYYEWHNGSNSRSILANFADTVNIVKVRDINNCWGFDSKIVKSLAEPEFELCPDTAICTGDTLELDAGPDFLEYIWFDDSRQQKFMVREPGEYWVKVLDGCFWLQDTTNVVYNETPVIARLDTAIYGQVVIYPEGGTEPYQYAINDGAWQEENVFKKLENGTYVLQVEDVNECAASDTISLNTMIDIDVPNFFTPNNDGFNDNWVLDGMEKFPDSIIRIYDRFGKLIIEYKASEPGWNGEYLGKPVSSDAYWYVIEVLPIEKFIKGHITLKR